MDVGLLLFRPDGALDFANGRAQAMFGAKDLHELEGRLDGVRERLMRLSPPSQVQGSVDVETTVEGRPRSLRLELNRVGNTESEGFLAVVTDEATMRALETDLRLAAHLRGLSRVSLAAAHDIRTPLHTVVLYLELLRNTLAEAPEADARGRQEKYLEVIGSEVQRLEKMMETLLSQARVSEDATERFDLWETLRDLNAFLEPYCRRTRVQVHFKAPEEPVLVEADKDAVRHALMHILIHAIDALPKEGEMGLELSAANGRAIVTLTGAAAIAPEILDSSKGALPAHRALGADRGLYAARRVVERHGGSINVRSGAQRATTLEIQLPLAAAEVD
ncbi:MAG TPA: HAMP domain-containing sensor histidine kinase [Candidatus Limnocylindrales bacterium]|nr:HAMP domain-containing sensor histidine kinase [Candidatus Limnocylindrales bacterium]